MSSVAKSGRTVDLQDRDLEILRGLFEARIMTAEHVAAMYFGDRYEAARKRLAKLKAAGFVGERPRRAYDPAVLFLTRKAFVALCQSGAIADLPRVSWPKLEKRVRVSDLTLRHELDVQDVRAAFHRAVAQAPGLAITSFSTWPLLFQFRAFNLAGETVTIKPDGFMRFREERAPGQFFEHLFYLELDRSSEPQATLVSRAVGYRDYYRRGGLAVRQGLGPEQFERFPFRVLFVLKNSERRNNTAENLLLARPPILSQVWLTTFSEATANPLGPIWVRPIDYRAVITGTSFEHKPNAGAYCRQVLREEWVEANVTKHPLTVTEMASPSVPDPTDRLT